MLLTRLTVLSASLFLSGPLFLSACGGSEEEPAPPSSGGAGGQGGAASTTDSDATPADWVGDSLATLNCNVPSSDEVTVPPGGTPVFAGVASFGNYVAEDVDVKVEAIEIADQEFGSGFRGTAGETVADNWSAQLVGPNTEAIAAGDVLLAEVWARCEKSRTESGECTTEFVFELRGDPYTKSVEYPVAVSHEWRRFLIPFEAVDSYDAGGANVSMRLGYKEQTVDIGKVEVTNFGKALLVSDLPKTQVSYRGMENDAAWRQKAQERIAQLRQAELTVVVTEGGSFVEGAEVKVTQQRHAYDFGSAVSAHYLAGSAGTPAGETYRTEASRLFNAVTLENALKWPSLDGDWGGDWGIDLAKSGLDWAESEELAVRGHVLVWPSFRNLPSRMEALQDSPDALRQAVYDHIDSLTAEVKGRLKQWDVLNEPYDNHDLMDILGEEEMIEWFRRARAGDPDAQLFINDYAILSGGEGDTPHRAHYEQTIQYLLDNDAELDGIGMQGHFGSGATPPEAILSILDRFAQFQKEIVVTEYDISTDDPQLSACFTRDFLTAIFSHESTSGFISWGFWDGAHWKEDAPYFDMEWSQKLAGRIYEDLVFGEWWTNETGTTDASGELNVQAFHGTHQVTVTVGGVDQTAQATVSADGERVTIEL